MSWLKNAYDLCKQFPIHCPQPSSPGLVLQLRVGIPSWDASKYVSVCVCVYLHLDRVYKNILWTLVRKSNFVSWTRDKRSLRM